MSGFIASSLLLLLMPKCPMCVVAYVMLFTGLSISSTVARQFQLALVLASVSVIALLVIQAVVWACRRYVTSLSS